MKVEKLFSVSAPILLCGETGTGKSRLARLIHSESPWAQRKFLAVQLSSLSENLIESELFGHCKGSFTGAINDKKGYCESVENGTLFLDEIGELSLDAQKKLLFLLEEKRFTPLGSCQDKPFRGRIIAATNKNLEQMVEQGKFREDLFFRLRVFTYTLPALRDQQEIILKLADTFLTDFCKAQNKPVAIIDNEAKKLLENYEWPGNIRELKNAMEFCSYCSLNTITINDFPSWVRKTSQNISSENNLKLGQLPLDYHQALESFEKSYFHYIARHFQGKINHTSRELNMSKSTLIAKFRKYGVNIWQIRAELRDKELQLKVA